MILSSTRYDAQTATPHNPLVVLHGLFGSARNWSSIARALSQNRDIIALSLRNHGDSPHDAIMTYQAMAQDIAETLEHLELEVVDLLGHSMGGKAAMTLALTQPSLIKNLVIVDIAPKMYRPQYSSYITAMQGVPLDQISRRSDADPYLQEVIPDPALRTFILQNLSISNGVARWQVNLDAIYTGMADIEAFPDLANTFDKPTLFLRGGTSDYVKEKDFETIQAIFTDVTIKTIPDVGHWPHAENPRLFMQMLTDWLDHQSET